jgi:hypothetical protein
MYRTVLLPLDGSMLAARALPYAARLVMGSVTTAVLHKANVLLLRPEAIHSATHAVDAGVEAGTQGAAGVGEPRSARQITAASLV